MWLGGGGCRWLLSYLRGFFLGRAKILARGRGVGLGSSLVLSIGAGQSSCCLPQGESTATAKPSPVLFLPYCKSSICTVTFLTPDLAGKNPHHLFGCFREKPRTLSPLPLPRGCVSSAACSSCYRQAQLPLLSCTVFCLCLRLFHYILT